MRVEYTIELLTSAVAAVELDADATMAWQMARSEAERRAIVEPLVREHAARADDWVYDMAINFGVVPEE